MDRGRQYNLIETLLVLLLAAIAVGQIPRMHLNRTTIALIGAVGLMAVGFITTDQAFRAVDLNTIVLLFSMMVFTAHLRLSGFFAVAGRSIFQVSRTPTLFLVILLVSSAVLSAIFINDTVMVMLTPIVAETVLAAGLNPIPFLIGLAVSSNIGSMVTPIGNPQNILIASSSHLGFGEFFVHLAIPGIVCLALAFALIRFFFHKDFKVHSLDTRLPGAIKVFKPLIWKCLFALILIVTGIALGWSLALAALSGASFLLFTRRLKPAKVFREVDWGLLVFFSSLFVITKTVEQTTGFQFVLSEGQKIMENSWWLFSGLSALLSNLISNVPAVMVLQPAVPLFSDRTKAWLMLASSSTLAGNLTLLGSVANLIVAESAKRFGIQLSFGAYLKIGLPLAILSIVLTTVWLIFF